MGAFENLPYTHVNIGFYLSDPRPGVYNDHSLITPTRGSMFSDLYWAIFPTLRKKGTEKGHFLPVRNLVPLGALFWYPSDRGVLFSNKKG